MNIKQIILDKNQEIKVVLISLVAAGMMFKINLGNLALIIAVSYNVFFFKKENLSKLQSFAFIFPALFFVTSMLSSVLSKDYLNGLKRTDLELLLVLIPIVIINYKVDKRLLSIIFKWLYTAAILSTSILLIIFIYKLLSGEQISNLIFHNFALIYDQHPVYYSMLLSLVLFSKTMFIKVNGKQDILGIAILICGIVLCVSKVILVVNILTYLIFFLLKPNKYFIKLALIGSLLVVFVSVFKISFINERFTEGLVFDTEIFNFKPTNDFLEKKRFTYKEKVKISDLELRYIFATIGLYHLIEDQKVFFGYGQGDAQNYLDYYFMSYNLAPNWYEGFNLHNQYLHILVTYGLFGFILFISYLLFSVYTAIRSKDILYLFFLAMILIVFIFEAILVRNKGIMFFYFFNSLFLFKNINFENCNHGNTRSTKLSWGI